MLTLLIFAPCEKVIIGSEDDSASIITVLETIKLNIETALPPDAMLPFRWTVLSIWKRDLDVESPVDFEQQVEVCRLDGSVAANGITKFQVTKNHSMYRMIVSFPLFPIGQPGHVFVRTRIRQTNPETEWSDVAEYPLIVVYEPKSETIAADNAPKESEEITKEA